MYLSLYINILLKRLVKSNKKERKKYLAQAMSWMTDPNNKKVQLNASPAAFQYGPSSPSSTSNHFPFFYFIFFVLRKQNKHAIQFSKSKSEIKFEYVTKLK